MMRSLYGKVVAFGESLQTFLLAAMRLYWGFGFFFAGLGKLSDIKKAIGAFGSLGIPYPEYMAPFVGWVECIGGICLLIGFASRLVAIPLAITMITALLTAHLEATLGVFQDPQHFINQAPFNFLLTCLIVLCFGPGKLSVDYVLERAFSKGGRER